MVDSAASKQQWGREDSRRVHVGEVLRMGAGDTFFVGVPNGVRGKARILRDDQEGMTLAITWENAAPAPAPIHLLVGLPRPQTARRVLFEAAVFGVRQLHFFLSERSEPSYADSSLWKTDAWQRHLRQGAEQAFATSIPKVIHHPSLAAALAEPSLHLPTGWNRIALDVYEAEAPLGESVAQSSGAFLAIGPERGWSPLERNTLRKAGFALASLGERILKTETACVAAMAVFQSLLQRRTQDRFFEKKGS